MRKYFIILSVFFISISGFANNKYAYLDEPVIPDDSLLNKLTDVDQRLKEFVLKDTLGGYSTPRKVETATYFKVNEALDDRTRSKDGLIVMSFEYEPFLSYMGFSDTILINSATLPIVFDGKLLPEKLDFRKDSSIVYKQAHTPYLVDRDSLIATDLYKNKYTKAYKDSYKLIDKKETLSSALYNVGITQNTRKSYYTANPTRIKSNALNFDGLLAVQKEVVQKSPFKDLITAGDAIKIERPASLDKKTIKQVYWKFWGEHRLDLSQKSYTENWNPSTNNSFHVQNFHKFNAKYKRNKIQFDHYLEWRLNIQSVSLKSEEKEKNPDYNSMTIGDDWLKTYNRLGLESFIKKWSYVFNLEAKTPLFNKYPQFPNPKKESDRRAGLFSPLDVNFGVGVGYSHERKSAKVKDRLFRFTLDATPFSLDIRHVGSRVVYGNNNHGVKYEAGDKKAGEPRYTKVEFGSTINSDMLYKLNSYSYFSTRLKYFTNYDRVYVELENNIRFQLNRYLASSLFVYMKFDDSVDVEKKDKTWGYFSFNEVLGFGLSYSW